MVVRGVRVVAPDGECPDSDGFSGPCYTRLLSTSIYVSNYRCAAGVLSLGGLKSSTFIAATCPPPLNLLRPPHPNEHAPKGGLMHKCPSPLQRR